MVPRGTGNPRRKSLAHMGFLPARCSSVRRTAPLPQATVGDHGGAGAGVNAISVTRHGDEAYDFRDIQAPA